MKPLFMWAGGKNKLIKTYEPYFPDKEIDTYFETFLGGGAMFIYIKNRYNPKRMVINDINKDVIRIYKAIKSDYKAFLERLDYLENIYINLPIPPKGTPRWQEGFPSDNRKYYYFNVRFEHGWDYEKYTEAEEAATLYFLMKTGFNGIYQINHNTNERYGTPAGLLNQKTQIYDRDVLQWWNEALQTTDIHSGDWRDVDYTFDDKTFAFFDPPYRLSFADYGNGFGDEDLIELIEHSDKFENVMLSNRNDDDWFDQFDNSLEKLDVNITYTAGRRKKTEDGFKAKPAKEILLYKK